MGQQWPAAGSGALNTTVHAEVLLKEVAITFITTSIVWPQPNNREGTQPHPSTENWIKELLSMAQHIRARPRFPHSQSLPSGSFHKRLIISIIYTHSVRFSCSVVSYSLRAHGLQHPRPPCPSPTPGVCSNSCPLSR